jgi:hypothetical protein
MVVGYVPLQRARDVSYFARECGHHQGPIRVKAGMSLFILPMTVRVLGPEITDEKVQ